MARGSIGVGGFLLRVAAALALVLLTYNPTGWSYHHWIFASPDGFTAVKALPGALLLCGWVLYVRAAVQSLGLVGFGLSALVIGSVVWLLAAQGWIDPTRPTVAAWIALVALGLVLGVGLGWSQVRRALTGQVDIEPQGG
jgi:hypothetical protein